MLIYEENEEYRDNTPGVWLLILINVGVFIYEVLCTQLQLTAFVDKWALTPAEVFGRFNLHTIQTFFTSMFIHGGFGHLFGNMLFLYVFGDNIENRMGTFKFLLFYLICGLVAGGSDVLLRHDLTIGAIGASGAISGVLGAYFVLHPNAIIRVWFSYLPPLATSVPAFSCIGVWFFMQVIFQFVDWQSGHVASAGIAWMAHIGGFLAGVLLVRAFAETDAKMIEESRLHEKELEEARLIEEIKKVDARKRRRITHQYQTGVLSPERIAVMAMLALALPGIIFGFLTFNAVKTIGTGNPLAYVEYMAGEWKASSQEYDEAKKHFDKAIALSPNASVLYYERAFAEMHLSQFEAALRDFRTADKYGRNTGTLGIHMGNCAYELGQYAVSIEYYNAYLEANPTSADALCNRGWSYLGLQKYDQALDDFEKSLKINSSLASAYSGIGACFYNMKKFDQAIKPLDRALQMNSSDKIALHYRGLVSAALHAKKTKLHTKPTKLLKRSKSRQKPH